MARAFGHCIHPGTARACAIRAASPSRLAARLRARLTAAGGGRARGELIGILAAILALDTADKGAISALALPLQDAMHISRTDIGLLLAVSSLVGAFATVPAGMLVDRYSRTRLLSAAVALWSVAMLAATLSVNFVMLLLAHVFLGVLTAIASPAVASLIGDAIPAPKRGTAYGYVICGELIGAGFGIVVAGNLAMLSWRAGFAALIPPTAIVWWLARRLPEPPRGSTEPQAPTPAVRSLSEAVRVVLSVRTNVRLVVASALGYFFFSGLRGFAVDFAKHHYRVSESLATSLTLLLGAGAVGGVLLGGRIADWLQRRGRLAARIEVPCALALAAVALIVPALITPQIWVAVPLLILALACLGGVNPPLDAARLDIMPPALWGRAEAIRSLLRNLADSLAPLMFGLMSTQLFTGGSALEYTFLLMVSTVVLAAVVMFRGRHQYLADAAAIEGDAVPATEEARADAGTGALTRGLTS